MKLPLYLAVFLGLQTFALTAAQPLACWKFDALSPGEDGAKNVKEESSGRTSILSGNAWLAPGVKGQALVFDGITARVLCPSNHAPRFSGAFTLEAWISIGAYPFNDCPFLQQQDGEKAGYFFGIGDRGQLIFKLAAGGKWQGAVATNLIPLRSWAHVAGAYEPGKGITIYVNGRPVAAQPVEGGFIPATNANLWIGRNMTELEQTVPVAEGRQIVTGILFDGVLDELTISSGASSAAEIASTYGTQKPSSPPPLEARVLPAGPAGPGSFGAFYTKLNYYKGWDDYWRVGDAPDVVVRFDETPCRFVFWRGTSYIPHWVTENGIWFNNEFTESFQPGLHGSAEPMSDKQCRFSHVRILESSPARAVVHWRYAPVDVGYTPAFVDPLTGWGDWTDEIYTLYPDGVSVRKITVHSSGPMRRREWQEGIVVMGPGMSPNEALDPTGLTLVDPKGDTHDYSWAKKTPPHRPKNLPDASIQFVNTKSKYKPFASFRSEDKPQFEIYSGEDRRETSIYPWWNHWPTAFEPSNGRYAQATDRASHSSLTNVKWNDYTKGQNWATKIMLHGLTDRPATETAAITRSWENPAALKLEGEGFQGGNFDQTGRAYMLTATTSPARKPLMLTVNGSQDSPIHNLAFIITNWGDTDAVLTMDGKKIPRGKDFRFGVRRTLESSDLVVWIKAETVQPLKISLQTVSE